MDDINDILNRLSSSPERDDDENAREKLEKSNFRSELEALLLIEKEQYLELRKEWSARIKVILWIILVSGLIFIFVLGFRPLPYGVRLEYTSYIGFPQCVLGSFFLGIIGLAFIVAKFLFPYHPNK